MTSFIRTPLANTDTLLDPFGVRIREVRLHWNSVGFHWVCYRGVIIVNGQLLFLQNDLVETWYINKAPGIEWIITGKNIFKYTVIFKKEPMPRGLYNLALPQGALDWLSRLKVSSFTERNVKQNRFPGASISLILVSNDQRQIYRWHWLSLKLHDFSYWCL